MMKENKEEKIPEVNIKLTEVTLESRVIELPTIGQVNKSFIDRIKVWWYWFRKKRNVCSYSDYLKMKIIWKCATDIEEFAFYNPDLFSD